MSENTGFGRVNTTTTEEQSMAQIREILFGEQARQTEQHFARLEARLREQENALRGLLDERIGTLAGQLQSLRDDLAAQDQRQGSTIDEMQAALNALIGRLDERLTLLDSDQQDLRQRQREDAKQQSDALDGLEQRTTHRGQLAELLEAMAGELRKSSDQ